MQTFTIEFVYSDEPTPRDLHHRTVVAIDEKDAVDIVLTRAILNGDRIHGVEVVH